MEILIQKQTQELLKQMIERSPHALLLSGAEGAGKAYAAKYFASNKLGLNSIEALDNYPYYKIFRAEKNSISIEQIRHLQKFLQLKTPGKEGVRRIVIVENAHYMTTEAQNALLKTLEEPPSDTMLILTAPTTLKLKDTIYSRVQIVQILPVSKQQAQEYFAKNTADEIDKAFLISAGQSGLLHAILTDTDHPLLNEIQNAKRIIGFSRFERLRIVEELSKQKELLPRFLQACKIICIAALNSAVAKDDSQQTKRWHKSLDTVYKAESSLQFNPNSKLLLTNLMIQL